MDAAERAKEIVAALLRGGQFVPNPNFYPGNIADTAHLQMAIEQEIIAAVVAERERCALLCEAAGDSRDELCLDTGRMTDPDTLAATIREGKP